MPAGERREPLHFLGLRGTNNSQQLQSGHHFADLNISEQRQAARVDKC